MTKLFLGVDGNFRMRNAMVSTPARDPPLADGKGVFVASGPYKDHIANHVKQEDLQSCSGFKAMFLADLKNAKGLRTTGVAGVTCARHGVWRRNGMGDLQKGERYAFGEDIENMWLIRAKL